MKIVKWAVMIVGALLFLSGLVWIGQGTGTFPYPATSPMIDQSVWAYRGIGLALFGLVLVGLASLFGGRRIP